MVLNDDFSKLGFLGEAVRESIPERRSENQEWFSLAADTNLLLMRVILTTMQTEAAHGSNWSREAVAVRLLMRSAGSFQGVVLMAERGMVVPARTLVRSIIEDSFIAGALTTKPDDVIKMLRDGAEASRRSQGDFILAKQLGGSDLDRVKLKEAIDKIDARATFLRPRKVADMSPMLPQYLNYMLLSEDSAHPSATSLHKHVQPSDDKTGWQYKMAAGEQDKVCATLHRALLAVLPVAIVANQLMPDATNSPALFEVGERFQALPSISIL